MFKSMKRIIKWAGKYKGRLYLGSVFSFFSSLSTAIPTMAAAYALDKAIAAYWAGNTIGNIQCLSPAKKYKLYKSSINKSLHFAQRRLSSSTRG